MNILRIRRKILFQFIEKRLRLFNVPAVGYSTFVFVFCAPKRSIAGITRGIFLWIRAISDQGGDCTSGDAINSATQRRVLAVGHCIRIQSPSLDEDRDEFWVVAHCINIPQIGEQSNTKKIKRKKKIETQTINLNPNVNLRDYFRQFFFFLEVRGLYLDGRATPRADVVTCNRVRPYLAMDIFVRKTKIQNTNYSRNIFLLCCFWGLLFFCSSRKFCFWCFHVLWSCIFLRHRRRETKNTKSQKIKTAKTKFSRATKNKSPQKQQNKKYFECIFLKFIFPIRYVNFVCWFQGALPLTFPFVCSLATSLMRLLDLFANARSPHMATAARRTAFHEQEIQDIDNKSFMNW